MERNDSSESLKETSIEDPDEIMDPFKIIHPQNKKYPQTQMLSNELQQVTPKVDLGKLSTPTLRRYCKFYSIDKHYGIGPYTPRGELLEVVNQHFASQPLLDKNKVIPEFVRAAAQQISKTKD